LTDEKELRIKRGDPELSKRIYEVACASADSSNKESKDKEKKNEDK